MEKLFFCQQLIIILPMIYSRATEVIVNTYKPSNPNSNPLFHFMTFDNTSKAVYIGGVDFIYKLNDESLLPSANLSTFSTYSSIYNKSFTDCINSNQIGGTCRNYMRIIQKLNDGQLYVCSTGAYNPQEFYLDPSTLSVNRVGSNANTKCPYEPNSNNIFFYSSDYNLYTGLRFDPSVGFSLFKLNVNSHTVLRNDMVYSDVDYIASFEIESYVYFFFREITVSDPGIGSFQHSKIARVCKNDKGGKVNPDSFMSYEKARIACIVNKSSKNPIVFNQLVDMHYDSNKYLFYGLFLLNSDLNFGSAVCSFNYSSIEKVFNEGKYVKCDSTNCLSDVTYTRATSCLSDLTNLQSNYEVIALNYFTLMDLIPQNTDSPIYYTNEFSFRKFASLEINSTHSLFYFVSDDNVTIIKRYLFNLFSANSLKLLDLKINSTVILSTFKDINIYKINEVSHLYLLYENALIRLPVNVCSSYKFCTDCSLDAMCKWESNVCSYSTRDQFYDLTDALKFCNTSCYVEKKNIVAIPGMSTMLPCNSWCQTDKPIRWLHNDALVDFKNSVLQSSNGSLVILSYTALDAGNYKCVAEGVTLSELEVTSSDCQYGEDIRTTMITEFKNYCSALDNFKNCHIKTC